MKVFHKIITLFYHLFTLIIILSCTNTKNNKSPLLVSSSSIRSSRYSKKGKATLTNDGSSDDNSHNRLFNQPDRFVSASPAAVAAVCRNGVALVALHTHAANEPLLLSSLSADDVKKDKQEEEEDNATTDRTTTQKNDDDSPNTKKRGDTIIIRDLPQSTRGPLRIEPIDSYGSALLCSGWRTDSVTLADYARRIAAKELERFGTLPYVDEDYGHLIAREMNSFMASCVVLESVRSLCSVGLFCTMQIRDGDDDAKEAGKGYLWLVDATGAYPCRAHAVGLGSKEINNRLLKENFEKLSVEEGAKLLLEVIVDEIGTADNNAGEERVVNENWTLPKDTRVEIAVLDSGQKKMRRLRQPFLV